MLSAIHNAQLFVKFRVEQLADSQAVLLLAEILEVDLGAAFLTLNFVLQVYDRPLAALHCCVESAALHRHHIILVFFDAIFKQLDPAVQLRQAVRPMLLDELAAFLDVCVEVFQFFLHFLLKRIRLLDFWLRLYFDSIRISDEVINLRWSPCFVFFLLLLVFLLELVPVRFGLFLADLVGVVPVGQALINYSPRRVIRRQRILHSPG